MTFRPLLAHLLVLKNEASLLQPRAMMAFCTACCERQAPVIYNATQDSVVQVRIRKLLDDVWNWILGGQVPSHNHIEFITLLEKASNNCDVSGCIDVIGALDSLIASLHIFDFDTLIGIPEISLNLIDDLLYNILDIEISTTNDYLIDEHTLMQAEITIQRLDIAELCSKPDQSVIGIVRQRSVNVCIFNEHWYRLL